MAWTSVKTWATSEVLTSANMNTYVSDNTEFLKNQVETNEETASYVLVIGDAGKVVEMNNGSANNLTVPPNSSVAFPTGTVVTVLQTGAGQTTLVAGSGVTINSADSALKIVGQWSAATLVKRATDTWVALGALAA